MTELLVDEPETIAARKGVSWWEGPLAAILRLIPGVEATELSNTFRTAVHGSVWTLIGYGGTQVFRACTTIILARLLLGPKDFGLVALVNVFLGGLDMLSDLGIGMDVVQSRRGDEPNFISTAWITQVSRGLILWALACSLAYPFAVFYKQPAVLWLLMVGALSTLIRGFASWSLWALTRRVQLKKVTLINLSGEGAGFLVALAWALVSPGAWALVIGRVASITVFVVGTHLVNEHGISLHWDRGCAKEIMAFGAGVFLSTSTSFLGGEAERLVVGKFVNLVELGCFSLALTISSLGTSGLQQIISQVFFPMISAKVRANPVKAGYQYGRVRLGLLAVCVVLAFGFITGSRWIVALVLGPQYVMTGWILQLIGFREVINLFIAAPRMMVFAAGAPKYAATGHVMKLGFLAAGLAVAFTRFGFKGAVWVLALSPIVAYFSLLWGIKRHFKDTVRMEAVCFAALLASGLLAAGLQRIIG